MVASRKASKPAFRRLAPDTRQAQLLAAALTVFGSRGYYLAQVDDVAQTAGVSKGLVYLHFTSKEQLFSAVSERVVDDYLGRYHTALGDASSPLTAWQAAVHSLVQLMIESPESGRFVVRHIHDPDLGRALRRVQEVLTQTFSGLILAYYTPQEQPAGTEGVYQQLSQEEALRRSALIVSQLVGALMGLMSWWIQHPEETAEEIERAGVELAWLGLDRMRVGELLLPPEEAGPTT